MSGTINDALNAAAAALLADASTASVASDAYLFGSAANTTLIAATSAALVGYVTATNAAEAAVASADFATATDVFATVDYVASLAQDYCAAAELVNVLTALGVSAAIVITEPAT